MPESPSWFEAFLELCARPAFEFGPCILVGKHDHADTHWRRAPADPTHQEAEFNLVILSILWNDSAEVPPTETLRRMGRVVIASWAIAIQPLLKGREVLMILSGSEDGVSIRFHVDRGVQDRFIDESQADYLRSNAVVVWRLSAGGLRVEVDHGAGS